MSYHTPAPPKIGQNPGFGGGYLQKQNLPGQSLTAPGGSSGWGGGYGQNTGQNFIDTGATGQQFTNPGGYTQSQGYPSASTPGVQNGVLSVNHNGNPFTSPHLFDAQTLKDLNEGKYKYGGSQGAVDLTGMLGNVISRGGGGAGLPGQNYQSYLETQKQQSGPQLSSIAQTAGPQDGLRTLSEAQMPTNYQTNDTGGNGWSPNDQGLQSGDTNTQNWAAAGLMNPGLRDPTGVAGAPVGAQGAQYGVGGASGQQAGGNYPVGGGQQSGQGQANGLPYSPLFDVNQMLGNINAPGAFDGKTQRDLYNRTAVNQGNPAIQDAIPELMMGFGPGNFQDRFTDPLATLAGPYFDEGATGLRDEQGGAALGASLNLLLSQMLAGGQRGQQRDQLFADNQQQAQGSSQNRANEFGVGAIEGLLNTGKLDNQYNQLNQAAREQSAASVNSSQNRMQDLGLASGGMGQASAYDAMGRGANRDLQNTLMQLTQMKEDQRRNNLSTAQGALGQNTDIFRALNMDPRTAQALNFATPQNTQVGTMADALERAAQISSGHALANKGTDPLNLLATLGGGFLGGVGQAGGFGNFFGGQNDKRPGG